MLYKFRFGVEHIVDILDPSTVSGKFRVIYLVNGKHYIEIDRVKVTDELTGTFLGRKIFY